jgi:CRISPR type I-F-associated protein Csy2
MAFFYIVIKNMMVINANLSSSYFSADLSQNAYLGFTHHLARFLDEQMPNKKNILGKIKTIPLGKEKCFAILKQFEFNQGHASFVGHLNDKNHKALNIPMNPPEIKGTLKQTLVMQLQTGHNNPKKIAQWVREFLLFQRFAGGDIQSADRLSIDILQGDEVLSDALQWERGWVVKDATAQLVEKAQQSDYSSAFCDFLSTFKQIQKGNSKKDDKTTYHRHHKGWFYASLAGYQLLQAPIQRQGARYGHPHAFAEPIIGLHQLEYFKKNAIQSLFWRSTFSNNTYYFKQD